MALTIAGVVPSAVALSVIGLSIGAGGARREIACWLMPNAYVMTVPGRGGCAARLNDRVGVVELPDGARIPVDSASDLLGLLPGRSGSLRVGVSRDGRLAWLDLSVTEVGRAEAFGRIVSALVLVVALLSVPIVVVWRTRSSSALPLIALSSLSSVVLVVIVAGRHLELLARAAILAMVLAPSVVAHLGFVFPRERALYRVSQRIVLAPYVPLLILVPAGAVAVDRDTVLWPTYVLVLVALTGGAWLMLILSCAFALRESESSVERARSKSVCLGAIATPLFLSLLLTGEAWRPAELVSAHLWLSAFALPGVIGFAVSRYNLFDPGLDVRWWVGRCLYLLMAGGAVALLIAAAEGSISRWGFQPGLAEVMSASIACVLLIEVGRSRLLGWFEAMLVRNVAVMRRARETFVEVVEELTDEEVVAERLGHAVSDGLGPLSGCVFSRTAGEWSPVAPFGEGPPTRASLARCASVLMGDGRLLHAAAAEEQEPDGYSVLVGAGVEVAVGVASGGELLGLMLLGPRSSGDAYGPAELEFVASLAAHAGIAIRNARLAAGLLRSERHATTGRIALTVAHEVGKELDWIRRLVRRLPQRRDDAVRFERDVKMIREFVDGVCEQLRAFVKESADAVDDPFGVARCDEVIEDAVRRVSRIHARLHVVQSIDPAIRSLRCQEQLSRVLANLMDNAVRASQPGRPIHLHATRDGAWMRFLVADQGCGMNDEVRRAAFRMGFTTRSQSGGLGVGLAISSEIVDALGGEIELDAAAGPGTRVRVSVPLMSQSR